MYQRNLSVCTLTTAAPSWPYPTNCAKFNTIFRLLLPSAKFLIFTLVTTFLLPFNLNLVTYSTFNGSVAEKNSLYKPPSALLLQNWMLAKAATSPVSMRART